LVRNLVVFVAAWASWALWIEYKVEDVVYLGTIKAKKPVLASGKKAQPAVQKVDPENLEQVLKDLQAKLAVNNSMD